MKEETVMKSGSQGRKRFAAACFLPAAALTAGGLIWSLLCYQGNIKNYVNSMAAYTCSYRMFMKSILQFGGHFPIGIPLCIYLGLALLAWGLYRFLAFGPGEMTLGEQMISGKTRFGNSVFLPVSQVKKAELGPHGAVILHIPGGTLLFPHVEKREEICRILNNLLNNRKSATEKPPAREISSRNFVEEKADAPGRYALMCFLPAAVLLGTVLIFTWPEIPDLWAYYWETTHIQQRQTFYSFLTASIFAGQMGQAAAVCLLLFFAAIPAGFWACFACLHTEFTASGTVVSGRGNYGSSLRIPAAAVSAVSRGYGKSLILYHAGGRTVFSRLPHRDAAYGKLKEQMRQAIETEKEGQNEF